LAANPFVPSLPFLFRFRCRGAQLSLKAFYGALTRDRVEPPAVGVRSCSPLATRAPCLAVFGACHEHRKRTSIHARRLRHLVHKFILLMYKGAFFLALDSCTKRKKSNDQPESSKERTDTYYDFSSTTSVPVTCGGLDPTKTHSHCMGLRTCRKPTRGRLRLATRAEAKAHSIG
jgi:hypothetical protein